MDEICEDLSSLKLGKSQMEDFSELFQRLQIDGSNSSNSNNNRKNRKRRFSQQQEKEQEEPQRQQKRRRLEQPKPLKRKAQQEPEIQRQQKRQRLEQPKTSKRKAQEEPEIQRQQKRQRCAWADSGVSGLLHTHGRYFYKTIKQNNNHKTFQSCFPCFRFEKHCRFELNRSRPIQTRTETQKPRLHHDHLRKISALCQPLLLKFPAAVLCISIYGSEDNLDNHPLHHLPSMQLHGYPFGSFLPTAADMNTLPLLSRTPKSFQPLQAALTIQLPMTSKISSEIFSVV